jgi:hypothetical protein
MMAKCERIGKWFVIPGPPKAEPGICFARKGGLQSLSMDFALTANLRLSTFAPDEFVWIAATQRPE